jgi:hypothetical protein
MIQVVVHKEQNRRSEVQIDDEFHPSLKHNRPEFWQWLIQDQEQMVLSFYITRSYKLLDGQAHCFWTRCEGQDIDAVTQGDVIESLEIIRGEG